MFSSRFRFPIICLVLSFLAGCNIDKSPLKTDTGIDPAIMGDWYYETTGTIAGDIYVEAIHGIRILEDGVILRLAVVTSTGKLTLLSGASTGSFLFAQNGRFRLRTNQLGFQGGPATTYNSTYDIKGNELTFERMTENGKIHILNEKYMKSMVGNIVTEPVQTHLEMMMGNEPYTNTQISSIPSAYAGYFENDTTLVIYAINQYGIILIIDLVDFNGSRTYQVGSETSGIVTLYASIGDIAWHVSTDQHPYAGNINIESFDLMNKRCSGTFEFEIDSVQYSNGIFSVPIYETNKTLTKELTH